jgi:Rad3-related DNA helicase
VRIAVDIDHLRAAQRPTTRLREALRDPEHPAWGGPWPESIEAFRPEQQDAIEEIVEGFLEVDTVLLDGPTGSGKTAVARAVARWHRWDSVYLCSRIALQEQMAGDYDEAVLVKGRSNYATYDAPALFELDPEDPKRVTCADCNFEPQTGCRWCTPPPGLTVGDVCPYKRRKATAVAAPLACLNTAYFATETRYAGEFIGRDLAVADEADLLESLLRGQLTINIRRRHLAELESRKHLVTLPTPRTGRVTADVRAWVAEARVAARFPLSECRRRSTGSVADEREIRGWETLCEGLDIVLEESAGAPWVVVVEGGAVEFKPVLVDKVARQLWWPRAQRWLLMSATLLDPAQLMRDLGVDDARQYRVVTMDSTFDPDRRQVVMMPRANVTKRELDRAVPKLGAGIREVLHRHAGQRVLVHTVSYGLQQRLREYLPDARCLWPSGAREVDALLDKDTGGAFLARPDAVLVGPAMERGLDLKDDLCRANIVAKVPYADLGDPQVDARMDLADGNAWYTAHTLRTLVQATGRGMRWEGDHCTTYILDEQFPRRFGQFERLLPAWWLRALRSEPAGAW